MPQSRFVYCLWLLLMAGLGACQDKPVVPTSAAATSIPSILSPSPTLIPTSFMTMTGTATPSPDPVEAAIPLRLPTSTPVPTITPTAAATPNVSRGLFLRISSQGQLAYIDDRLLYVEQPIRSHHFQLVSTHVGDAEWSPDSSMLLYNEWSENGESQFHLWLTAEGKAYSLTELGLPLPTPITTYGDDQIYPCFEPWGQWLPDSQRILLAMNLEPDPTTGANEYATLIDLQNKTFHVLSPIHDTRGCIFPINNDLFLHVMVYSNASGIEAINYAGEQLWVRMIDRLFMYDIVRASDGDFVYLVYPEWQDNLVTTVTKMNLRSGEETVFWYAEPEERIGTLALSPDRQFLWLLLFSGNRDQLLVDESGRVVATLATFTDATLHWQPGGELVISSRSGFAYVRRSDFSVLQEVQLPGWDLTVRSWSPDGQYLLAETWDNEQNIGSLYLWQPGMESPTLFWQGKPDDNATDFQWSSDGRQMYFVLSNQSLWVYDLVTEEIDLLAAAN